MVVVPCHCRTFFMTRYEMEGFDVNCESCGPQKAKLRSTRTLSLRPSTVVVPAHNNNISSSRKKNGCAVRTNADCFLLFRNAILASASVYLAAFCEALLIRYIFCIYIDNSKWKGILLPPRSSNWTHQTRSATKFEFERSRSVLPVNLHLLNIDASSSCSSSSSFEDLLLRYWRRKKYELW